MECARVVELPAALRFEQRRFAIIFLHVASFFVGVLSSGVRSCIPLSSLPRPWVEGDRDPFPGAGGTFLTLDARSPFVMAVPVFFVFVALARPRCWLLRLRLPKLLSLLAWIPEDGGIAAGKVCFRLV